MPKTKQVLIQIRIPAPLHKKLVDEARANERSMTSHARWLLTSHLMSKFPDIEQIVKKARQNERRQMNRRITREGEDAGR